MTGTKPVVNVRAVGALSLLSISLIVLKILDYITWSWWLITLPLWFGPTVFLLIAIVASIFIFVNK